MGDQTYTFMPTDPTSIAAVDIIYAISDGEGG